MNINKLSTPCIIIDENIMEVNIKRAQAYFNEIGRNFRVHIKTHKIPQIAQLQLNEGAVGINCQKISEAVHFASYGIKDILLTYNVIGESKLTALRELSLRCDLKVTADNLTCAKGLADFFKDTNNQLKVLVECDTGANRCGVQNPKEALRLAHFIDKQDGLEFYGFMTYPKPNTEKDAEKFFKEAKNLTEDEGIKVTVMSTGGTPSLYDSHLNSVATEHRAGTYVFADRSLITDQYCKETDCALNVLSTVVSVANEHRFIIDAGSKSLSSDLLNNDDYGLILGHEDSKIISLSEEHGIVISSEPHDFSVGDKIRIIPNHSCVVCNLFDKVNMHKNGELSKILDVAARGCVY